MTSDLWELAVGLVLLVVSFVGLLITSRVIFDLVRDGKHFAERARDNEYSFIAWWKACVPANDKDGHHSSADVAAGIGTRVNKDGKVYLAFEQAPTQSGPI